MTAADIALIPGLVSADQRQAVVRVVNTFTNGNFTTWSPAIHQHFPPTERAAIVATLLELRRAGVPNDVIVGHAARRWADERGGIRGRQLEHLGYFDG